MARIAVSNPWKDGSIDYSEALKQSEKEFLDSFKTLDEIDDSEQEWVIDRVIPKGAVTLLNYSDSMGKTCFMSHLVSALSSGRKSLLDSENFTGRDPERIAYLSEDMETYAFKEVLTGCGANTENIVVFDEAHPEVKHRMKIGFCFFEKFLAYYRPDLMILDSVEDFFADDCKSEYSNLEMLRSIAERFGTAFLIVSYKDDELIMCKRDRAADIARSVLSVGYSDKDSAWYVKHERSNYGVPVDTVLFKSDSDLNLKAVGTKRRLKNIAL